LVPGSLQLTLRGQTAGRRTFPSTSQLHVWGFIEVYEDFISASGASMLERAGKLFPRAEIISYLSDGSRHGYTISDPTDAYFRAEPARRAEHSSISRRISGGAPRDDLKPSPKVLTTKYRSIPSSGPTGIDTGVMKRPIGCGRCRANLDIEISGFTAKRQKDAATCARGPLGTIEETCLRWLL